MWKKDFCLVGSSETTSLSKLLMRELSPQRDPLYAYHKYVGSSVSLHVDHSLLSVMDEKLLGKFYETDNPKVDPKYFCLLTGSFKSLKRF